MRRLRHLLAGPLRAAGLAYMGAGGLIVAALIGIMLLTPSGQQILQDVVLGPITRLTGYVPGPSPVSAESFLLPETSNTSVEVESTAPPSTPTSDPEPGTASPAAPVAAASPESTPTPSLPAPASLPPTALPVATAVPSTPSPVTPPPATVAGVPAPTLAPVPPEPLQPLPSAQEVVEQPVAGSEELPVEETGQQDAPPLPDVMGDQPPDTPSSPLPDLGGALATATALVPLSTPTNPLGSLLPTATPLPTATATSLPRLEATVDSVVRVVAATGTPVQPAVTATLTTTTGSLATPTPLAVPATPTPAPPTATPTPLPRLEATVGAVVTPVAVPTLP